MFWFEPANISLYLGSVSCLIQNSKLFGSLMLIILINSQVNFNITVRQLLKCKIFFLTHYLIILWPGKLLISSLRMIIRKRNDYNTSLNGVQSPDSYFRLWFETRVTFQWNWHDRTLNIFLQKSWDSQKKPEESHLELII